ncbi:MAG: Fe-S cluster assembly ATPase SufC [bacterium]|nr:Fe-S cluster assembly ATPase SufC [bacterium]
MTKLVNIKNLHVTVKEGAVHKTVLEGVSLQVGRGEIHALMGPNGSGKSSLAYAVMGHPLYRVTKGSITFQGKNLLVLKPEQRARLGIFLSFQEPPEVGGVALGTFLRTIAKKQPHLPNIDPLKDAPGRRLQMKEAALAMQRVKAIAPALGLQEGFFDRALNEGFSGGEKKKSEILQMLALKPKLAIIDEIDSGLDFDSLKTITASLKKAVKDGMGLVLISHYTRIFKTLKPKFVHVLKGGKIAIEGGSSMLKKLDSNGYGNLGT